MPQIHAPRRLVEALAAHDRGWLLTPLIGKKPQITAWQAAPAPDRAQVEAWAKKFNLGVRTGVTPGPGGSVLVVVDVDPGASEEWAKLESTLATVMSRTPRGGIHAYLWGPPGLRNSVGSESNSRKLALKVDVRAVGGQCVLVGAEGYEWIHAPGTVDIAPFPQEWLDALADTTQAAVKRAANRVAKALPGGRNDSLNREAFRIAAVPGVDPRNARLQLAMAASQAGLDRPEINATLDSAFRARSDHTQHVLIPGIHGAGQEQELGAFVEQVLAKVPAGALYARENVLGVVQDARWRPVDCYEVMAIVDAHVRLQRTKDGKSGVDTFPMMCSRDHAMGILSNGARHVRKLRAVCTHPVIRPDGSALLSGFYDGILVDCPAATTPIDPRELLVDLPIDDVGRTNYLCYLLTLMAHPTLDACVPAFVCTAPEAGSGKTLFMAIVAGILIDGRPIACERWPDDEDEVEKKLIAKLTGGSTRFCLDNVHERLDSPALASFITAPYVGGRILGKSFYVELQNLMTVAITGNNTRTSGEMARRTCTIAMRGVENPSKRGFTFRPAERAYEIRAGVLSWLCEVACGKRAEAPIMGGFERWRDTCAAPLAGMDLPVLADENVRLAQNDDNAGFEALVEAWHNRHGDEEVNGRAVLAIMDDLELFQWRLGTGDERKRLTRLGFVLQSLEGRVIGGMRVARGRSKLGRTYILA